MTQIFNKESEKSKRRALRNEMPKAERLLWGCLRNKKLDGFHVCRSMPCCVCWDLNSKCPTS